MSKFKAIVEIDLEDVNGNDPSEVSTIEEAIFQAINSMLDDAGYAVYGFKSVVLFEGDDDD